jgi:integrase
MFSLAVKDGKLYNRPHIPMLKESNVRAGFFEREQFESVRSHLPAALQPLATFFYLTGWRKSEVLSLQWRNVDLEAGVVRLDVGTTKNDRGRVLPYGDALPEMRTLLEAQREMTRAIERERGIIIPWVFHRNGKRIASFYGAWHSACGKAGCPGRVPHDFRRTATRNLTRAGAPERVAMQVTGHKTRSVFDRYDIVNEADIANGLRRIAGSINATVEGTLSGTGQRFRKVASR